MDVPSDVGLCAFVERHACAFGFHRGGAETGHQHIFLIRLDRRIDVEYVAPLFGIAVVLHTEHGVQSELQLLLEQTAIHCHCSSLLSFVGCCLDQGVRPLRDQVGLHDQELSLSVSTEVDRIVARVARQVVQEQRDVLVGCLRVGREVRVLG